MTIDYRVRLLLENAVLNALFSTGWPSWQTESDTSDWLPVLAHGLTYVGAFDGEALIGFVNVAWDGRDHAFLLDPRVHPDYRRQGVGRELIRIATVEAEQAGCEWLHVDHEPDLAPFYEACGFRTTGAGLIYLRSGHEKEP